MQEMLWSKIYGVRIFECVPSFDQRGFLLELFRQDEMNGIYALPSMCYLSVTEPGVSRGPHEHLFQTDYFVFVTPRTIELHLWENRKMSGFVEMHEVYKLIQPTIVIVPPGVVHGYKNIGKEPAYIFNAPDKLYAGWKKRHPVDEVRHENMGASEFSMET